VAKNYVEALPEEHMLSGLYTKHLDKKFYKKYIKEAEKLGIDPYWYVAHTIKELGGIREEGKEQKIRSGIEGAHVTDLSMKPEGQPGHRGARGLYGPGAILPADPAGRRFIEPFGVPGSGSYRFKGKSKYKDNIESEQAATKGIRMSVGDMSDPSKPALIAHDEMYNVENPRNKFSMMLLSDVYRSDVKGQTTAESFQRLNPGESGYGESMKEIYEGLKTRSEYQWIRNIIEKPKSQEDVIMTDWLNEENWGIGNTKSQVVGK